MTTDIKSPKVLDNVFSDLDFIFLKNFALSIEKNEKNYEPAWGRYVSKDKIFREYSNKYLLPIAKKYFEKENLILTHSVFAEYKTSEAVVDKHKDLNAATYVLNVTLYEDFPWPLYIEGQEYYYGPNQGIIYTGEHQDHWRNPVNTSASLGILFSAFVEPDHWWVTEGPGYGKVSWEEITKEEYYSNKEMYDRSFFE